MGPEDSDKHSSGITLVLRGYGSLDMHSQLIHGKFHLVWLFMGSPQAACKRSTWLKSRREAELAVFTDIWESFLSESHKQWQKTDEGSYCAIFLGPRENQPFVKLWQ